METEQHYYRVGLFIVGLAALIALFSVWLVSHGNSNKLPYRMYFSESVSGLTVGSAVKFRGVNVGQVEELSIDKRDPQLVRVDVRIDEGTPVKTDTIASLKLQGITGAVFIDLNGTSREAQALSEVVPDVKRPVIRTEASSIAAIMSQLPVIMDKFSKFADQLGKIATDENVAHINSFIGNMSATSGTARQELRSTMGNLRRASRDIGSVTGKVEDNPSSLIFPQGDQGVPTP